MSNKIKTTKHFSFPLMKQNIKSNIVLAIAVSLVLCLMTIVVSVAMNILGNSDTKAISEDTQEKFYQHLFAIANYNQMTGSELSAEDFMETDDKSVYDQVFDMINAQSDELDLSTEHFSADIDEIEANDGSVESYVTQFEYVYALSDEKGIFTDSELSVSDIMSSQLSSMGLEMDSIEKMGKMDKTTMLNTMYFTVMGLLPTFLFIVIVANGLIANQIDNGSMAYVLATPTKRSAVANTQAMFLLISPFMICTFACIVKIIASNILSGEPHVKMYMALYLGMYILIEAVGGICYMGSCIFNQSRKATGFGGTVAVWCFIASLLGMFGADDMVSAGMGVEELGIFNKLTLVGLYDIKSLSTVGSSEVDYTFVWKICVLAAIAIISYIIGKIYFQKKDLTL